MIKENKGSSIFTEEYIDRYPGPFFVYTSNVDSHSQKSGFREEEVYEIHGSTELWQCSQKCKPYIWKSPPEFTFNVDKTTMLCNDNFSTELVKDFKENNGFSNPHPRCIYCGMLARPSILMFGDSNWVEDSIRSSYFHQWKTTVFDLLSIYENKRAVILEIGCGNRVATVRYQTQSIAKKFPGQITLIRINPDFPLVDGEDEIRVISIMDRGLKTIKQIQKCISKIQEKNKIEQ